MRQVARERRPGGVAHEVAELAMRALQDSSNCCSDPLLLVSSGLGDQCVALDRKILIDTITKRGRGRPVDQAKQKAYRDPEQPSIKQRQPGPRGEKAVK